MEFAGDFMFPLLHRCSETNCPQDVALIDACDEMLQRDVAKYSEMVTHWSSEAAGEWRCSRGWRKRQRQVPQIHELMDL